MTPREALDFASNVAGNKHPQDLTPTENALLELSSAILVAGILLDKGINRTLIKRLIGLDQSLSLGSSSILRNRGEAALAETPPQGVQS